MNAAAHPHINNGLYALITAASLLVSMAAVFWVTLWMVPLPSQWLSAGMMADLVVTLPLVYWIVVRRRQIPVLSVLPVIVAGAFAGWLLLPAAQAAIAVKIGVTSVLVSAAFGLCSLPPSYRRIKKRFLDIDDPCRVRRIQSMVAEWLPGKLAQSVAQEATTLYYLLRRPNETAVGNAEALETPDEARTFSYHKESGISALLAVGVLIVFIEVAAAHLLLGLFSHLLAWIATLSSLYFGLLIVAQLRAIRTRPIFLDAEKLHIRNGMVNLVTVPFEQIESVSLTTREPDPMQDVLKASFPASHNVLLVLRETTEANLLYGAQKSIKSILINVDKPREFVDAIQYSIGNGSELEDQDDFQGMA